MSHLQDLEGAFCRCRHFHWVNAYIGLEVVVVGSIDDDHVIVGAE